MNRRIDDEVDHILTTLSRLEVESKEYEAAVKNLQILCEARSKKPSRLIEPEVILSVAANVLGILLILHYEELNVIATKAIGFVKR